MLELRTHGKWILAGEHTVLRGGSALVFPVASRFLDFVYQEGSQPLSLELDHANRTLEASFWEILGLALKQIDLPLEQIKGHLQLSSNIPIGAGMGASATLCVSLAKWLTHLGHLESSQQYMFAKKLEDYFHGKSSGVDVAVALNKQPLRFTIPESIEFLKPSWKPRFYLSYCGEKGETKACIEKVRELIKINPELAKQIDERMIKAVRILEGALTQDKDSQRVCEGIDLANQCFKDWGLVTTALQTHMTKLEEAGALAVKPTGSGGGGFVLSYWADRAIPVEMQKDLIEA